MAKKKLTPLTIHVVLDRSGSMITCKDDTIGAFNQYVETMAKENPESRLSLTIFDSQSIDTIIDDKKITKVEKLTEEEFQPRASTPLYDAIGRVVPLLTAAAGKAKVLVILTDGQENASREFNKSSIKTLLDERQEKDNWLVQYLGANQDAFAEGSAFGAHVSNTVNFSTKGMRNTMSVAASSAMRYAASGSLADAAYTTEERTRAMTEDDTK